MWFDWEATSQELTFHYTIFIFYLNLFLQWKIFYLNLKLANSENLLETQKYVMKHN